MTTANPNLAQPALTATDSLSGLRLSGIFICFLMNMLDGMNVMAISYTSASIGAEWLVSAPALGGVFSAGLVGMAIGGMGLSPVADRIGRKTLILLCAGLMGLSMITTVWVQSVTMLGVVRLISGISIGGMLASTATLTAEYAPKQRKDFCVSFVMGGYPIGAVLSGLVTAQVIAEFGWRMVFGGAGVLTLLTLPLIWFFLAESLDFLLKKQPPNALHRANHLLGRLGEPRLSQLPLIPIPTSRAAPIATLFADGRRAATLQLWTALFMAMATLYFLTSWIPKLASNAGLSLQLAIYAGTVFNLGAFGGIITQGYLSGRFGLRRTICGFLLGTAGLMLAFGLVSGSAWVGPAFRLVLFGLIGFGIQGGFVGLYAVAVRLYPTEIRATGVGWAIGLGRAGGIVGPLVGGVLIGAQFSMTTSFLVFAVPLLIGSAVTLLISSPDVP